MCRFRLLLLVSAVLSAVLLAIPALAADEKKDASADKPIATDKIKDGLVVEVWRIFRSSDGLTEVHFGYRNPTNDRKQLLGNDEARDFPGQTYLVDAKEKKKYHVAAVTAKVEPKSKSSKTNKDKQLMASYMHNRSLEPGESIVYWAKFPSLPEGTKEVSLYLPNAPPQEDLAVGTAPEMKNSSGGDAPLTVIKGPAGLDVEITRVRRTSDGLLDIRWQYVNHSDQRVHLFSNDEARDLPQTVFVEDPDAKMRYPVATDDRGAPLMAQEKSVSLDSNGSEALWAKFLVPADAKRISLFLPGALPAEDLPIPEKK